MPNQIICDCPYMFSGGECVNQAFKVHEAYDCANCSIYQHWYQNP